jgi:hypothetical protein
MRPLAKIQPHGRENSGRDRVKNLEIASIDLAAANRNGRTMRRRSRRSRRQLSYGDNGGATDQHTQLSTARWPCAPNSRWQLSLMRGRGSSLSQAVKRTSDNIKSNILIRLGGRQSSVTCQMHNSPNFTSTSSKIFAMCLAWPTGEEIAAAALKRACDARYAGGEAREGGIVIRVPLQIAVIGHPSRRQTIARTMYLYFFCIKTMIFV